MILTGSSLVDADRAFGKAARSRRLAEAGARLRGICRGLRIAEPTSDGAVEVALSGVREIALERITATVEPSRADQFDTEFLPRSAAAAARWKSLWVAEQQGRALPPIAVFAMRNGDYAVRDGHHRVSVARARGAIAIDAIVEGGVLA